MLAEDAIKSAISDFHTKNPQATDLSGRGAPIPEVQVESVEKEPASA